MPISIRSDGKERQIKVAKSDLVARNGKGSGKEERQTQRFGRSKMKHKTNRDGSESKWNAQSVRKRKETKIGRSGEKKFTHELDILRVL